MMRDRLGVISLLPQHRLCTDSLLKSDQSGTLHSTDCQEQRQKGGELDSNQHPANPGCML